MKLQTVDWWLVTPLVLLMLFGLVILRSVDPTQVVEQGIIMLVGLGLFFALTFIDYRLFSHLSWGIYALTILSLLTTMIIGQTTRGVVSWIPIGPLQLQTSEIAKPLLALFFASIAYRYPPDTFKNTLISLLLFLIPAFLVFRQPDFGSAMVIGAMWLGIVFAAGLAPKFLLSGIFALVILLPLGWQRLADYQRLRVITFINPLSDPLKNGYNLLQSIIAVGSGEFFGRGLGQGTQSQLRFLPERHTDFVFASLSEELGLVGASLLLGLFTLLLARVLKIAKDAPDSFGSLICFGVFSQVSFQIFINVGMNIGLVPITGITLPFISSGGSSLLATCLSLGLVGSVALRRKTATSFEIR
ncbi:MAG: rod shape-determining protein RodA [Candidatus Chisholmbacteria bacterium]|nr:rod shape-determining protein RodA [Candidatus Chisholmbacteria bacterium]